MFQFPKNKRIINIKANSPSGQILLQGTSDIEYFYSQLRYFLEEKLLTSMKDVENIERVQSILNIPAHKVGQLGKYSFDPDVRIGELIILIGIYCTFKNLNTIEFEYIPGWQVPNQKAIVKKHFKKESLDGYILTAQNDEVIALPLELKSLMQNPNEPMEKTPIDQLKEKLSGFSKHFQQTGGIYCVLVMPYSIEKSLSIDLKEAIPLFKKFCKKRFFTFLSRSYKLK